MKYYGDSNKPLNRKTALKDVSTDFTRSRASRGQCDSCEALRINGVYCHEIGCPNRNARYIDGVWVKFVECRECGCDVEVGESCSCNEPCEE